MSRRRLAPAALAAGCLLAAGCGGPPPRVVELSGRVTLGGAPVTGGRLFVKALTPDSQVMATTALIAADGSYIVSECPVGPVALAVDTEAFKRDLIQMNGSVGSYQIVPIPKKYTDVQTSGITCDVKPPRHTFDIQLQP